MLIAPGFNPGGMNIIKDHSRHRKDKIDLPTIWRGSINDVKGRDNTLRSRGSFA